LDDTLKETLRTIRDALDAQRPVLLPLRQMPKPPLGWIATVRSALGMSQNVLANRLQVAKQRVSQLEAREITGETTLAQMRDAADALGCDFIYAFVPRMPLEETVSRRAYALARKELAAVERSMQLEDQETPLNDQRIRDYATRYISERDLWRDER
jgi:predicted DNA-binding mobile mystery protein A